MYLRAREAAGRVDEHAARAQLTEAVTQQRRLQHAQRGEPDPNPNPNPNHNPCPNPSPSPSPNPSPSPSPNPNPNPYPNPSPNPYPNPNPHPNPNPDARLQHVQRGEPLRCEEALLEGVPPG